MKVETPCINLFGSKIKHNDFSSLRTQNDTQAIKTKQENQILAVYNVDIFLA